MWSEVNKYQNFILLSFVLSHLEIKINNFILGLVVILMILMVNLLFCSPPREKYRNSKDVLGIMLAYKVDLFLVGTCIWLVLFQPIAFYSPLQGHVTVEMDDIYYRNNAPIPVSIEMTVPNTGLLITLSREESGHSLTKIDSVIIYPERNETRVTTGENLSLSGNALEYGIYSVFINTTNLSTGYYELVCVRPKYDMMYGARSFYLL